MTPVKAQKNIPLTVGSVLGPLLWIVMYDGILSLKSPRGTTIIGYVADKYIVVVARHGENLRVNGIVC